MTKNVKRSLVSGIILTVIGFSLAVSGIATLASGGNSRRGSSSSSGWSYSSSQPSNFDSGYDSTPGEYFYIYLDESVIIPSNTTRYYEVDVSAYTDYQFQTTLGNSLYVTVSPYYGSSTIKTRSYTSAFDFYSSSYTLLSIKVENDSNASITFFVSEV